MKLLAKGVNASRDIFRTVKHLRWSLINGSKLLTFSVKSSILDIMLGPENASGFTVLNYFHQKLHLRSQRGLIYLCIYLVQQFWRWINEISKVCYEETQNSCTKYVISENSCLKNFTYFQEKHPHEIAFLNKVAGYLTLTGNVLLGNLCNFKNSFHKKHPRMAASAISYQLVSTKYIFQKISHSICLTYVLAYAQMFKN